MAPANLGAICATVVAAFALCNVAVEPAHAQFPSWFQFRPGWGNYAPVRHKHHRRADRSSGLTEKAPAREVKKGPLQIIISLADQQIAVYDDGELIARSSVSTGVPDHPTPTGVFSVISKHRWHRSNLYSDAPMPYMQRITWSGIALHAGDLPGYPASHGCIRLKKDFAIRLWHLTKRGTRVIIAPNDVQPVEIAHPHLSPPKPKVAYAPKTAAVISDNAMIDTGPLQALPTSAEDPQQVTAEIPGSGPASIARRKTAPMSIFVSRKSNKLFVRHGLQPLLEAPVTIQDPEAALGTHVFTLMASRDEGAASRWTVVSIPDGPPRAAQGSTRRHKSAAKHVVETAPLDSSPEKAHAALSRIEMPPDVVERLAELLTPGSSLIVSDHGVSKETGHDTDFIVETR